ncbi:MAG: 50S ribosomal protein L6 [Akkermansiaceae bacterium]|nr:50S ribosomal protein L6 [Akkermansiaceae bacterium]NNM28101.1 50S ribosomal protein L6 [Akkermansiaceae bacterium]
MSRVGQKPISLPDKVSVSVNDAGAVTVEGPKGKLEWSLPEGISLSHEDGAVRINRKSDNRRYRALHGTARSLINNMMQGVSEGFSKDLEIQGVGFRATVKGKNLDLSLGKSHPIVHPIPEQLTVTVTDNTKIKVEGIDKQIVGQFASDVRSYYPPEPYKGKGVRYVGEYVRRKAGKSVQK